MSTGEPTEGGAYLLEYAAEQIGLGADLARLEMRVMFEELLARFSTYELVEPVGWTRSNRHTGIRHLILQVTP